MKSNTELYKEVVRKRKPYSIGIGFILMMLVPFFTIDLIEILGNIYFREGLGNFVCAIFPVLKISILFVPHQLISFAGEQCSSMSYQEPMLSIMFLMIKVGFVVLAGISLLIWVFIPHKKNPIFVKAKIDLENEGFFHYLKRRGIYLFAAWLISVIFYLEVGNSPSHFKLNYLSKLNQNWMMFGLLIPMFLYVDLIRAFVLNFINFFRKRIHSGE